MIRVSAPTRLHFGLVQVPSLGATARQFGGCGLMLAEPRVAIQVERASQWCAQGPESTRALQFARRVAEKLMISEPLGIKVDACPPGHTGLGVGTALGLAIARGITVLQSRHEAAADELAALTGRGERSAVGVRGAGVGGFIIDGGRAPNGGVGLLLARLNFPDWPVVLMRPVGPAAWHGQAEQTAFDRPRDPVASTGTAAQMAHTLLLGIWPAILERDYPAFAEAIVRYNRLAGEPFAADQGGVYSSPDAERLIQVARHSGGLAAGQSSWGPTLFAICPDAQTVESVVRSLTVADPDAVITVTHADLRGAVVSECAD